MTVLDIRDVSKFYGARSESETPLHVLDDINISVPKNQFVCLLGASGCGKTTLLRAVAGLIKPDAGQIVLDGRVIQGPGQDRSMVFQNYGLLPWRSIMRNVEFGLEIRGMPRPQRRAICQDYINRVGLAGFESHYPHQISGGMQQRVALARAFSKEPKILLMDEPFAAVDMQTREQLQEELLLIWSKIQTTVLFVTHSIEEAIYLADRVIVMGSRPGRVLIDLPTELPRPRSAGNVKESKHFDDLRHTIRNALQPH